MAETEDDKPYDIKPKRRLPMPIKLGAAALLLGGVSFAGYQVLTSDALSTDVATSETEEYQAEPGEGFGNMQPGEDPPPRRVTVPQFDAGPLESELEAQRRAAEARNAQLAEEVAALQARLQELANQPREVDNSAAIADALRDVQQQNADLITQLQSEFETQLATADLNVEKRLAEQARLRAEAEAAADERARAATEQLRALTSAITTLQRENKALEDQMTSQMDEALIAQEERQRLAEEEARRRAAQAERQAAAVELMEKQIRSEGVIFDQGPRGGGGGNGPSGESTGGVNSNITTGGRQSRDQAARAFVAKGASPVAVAQAEVIANPSNTVLQGTIIKATLETAINTSQPGQISAMVNFPVYSFDAANVLIPAGSRLIGSYNTDLSIGDRRVLVRWNRVVTPEGQSVQFAAYGADEQGRSGVTGRVDTRFGLRFGSAALLSIIGAAPAIAASSSNDPVAQDVAEEIGDNFYDATDGVIGDLARIPPIIKIEPGAAITVIVDRDLEFFS